MSKIQTILVVVAALVVGGAFFRQQRDLRALRATLTELTNKQPEIPAVIQAPSPDATEIRALRAEIAQLRREKLNLK